MLARWALLAAVLLAACSPFASERPVYPPTEGVAAFGTAPARLTLRSTDDDQVLRGRLTFADGQYRLTARDPDRRENQTLPFSLHPMAGIEPAGAFFIVQAEQQDSDAPAPPPPPTYVYEILRLTPDGYWLYGVDCTDLTQDERVAFGFLTPEAAAREPPPEKRDLIFGDPSCSVTDRAQVERAFDVLARRKTPGSFGTVKPIR